jgi:hypothetical protein
LGSKTGRPYHQCSQISEADCLIRLDNFLAAHLPHVRSDHASEPEQQNMRIVWCPRRDSNPCFGLERLCRWEETYARNYARDRPLRSLNHPPPAKHPKKTPRQVRDLPRGFDLPACLTGQCANQAAPRPRPFHNSYLGPCRSSAVCPLALWASGLRESSQMLSEGLTD